MQRRSHRVEKCSMWLFKVNRYSHWGQHSKGKHILYYDPYTGKVKNTSPKRGGIRRAGGSDEYNFCDFLSELKKKIPQGLRDKEYTNQFSLQSKGAVTVEDYWTECQYYDIV